MQMSLEHHDHVRRTDDVSLGLHHRLAGLRSTLRERRVLVVGRMAVRPAMLTLLRYAGARFMAAADLETALHLARRFAIDVVIADAEEDEQDLAPFQREGMVVVRPNRPLVGVLDPVQRRVRRQSTGGRIAERPCHLALFAAPPRASRSGAPWEPELEARPLARPRARDRPPSG